ncbi:MAG: hypothetical protein LKF79_02615 [Solobacterium sp.]|jgi:hypothetical protein|nr:hypothetical protein [Solobacterium sp.]MCH4222341.1 hypothetical protein [Solobacterium sp.]MCH4265520.1 hypothetical protein [Solobacterium sp.]
MSEQNQTAVNAEELYEKQYIPKVHRIGTASMLLILVLSFVPAVYFSFFKGLNPGMQVIAKAAATMIGLEIFTWILEPTLYFPMLGITGSYISFVAGNITNMRVPAATAAQTAVDAKVGTHKAEFAGVLGIISSVVVNFIVLIIVVAFGSLIISVLPQAITDALNYALPSVYGALLVTFIVRLKR